MCPFVFITLLGGVAVVLYFAFSISRTPADRGYEGRSTLTPPNEPPKEYAPKGSPEDREWRRRQAVRKLSPTFEAPEGLVTPGGMYWDTLLGEYCYLAEHIFFLRELEAYDSESRNRETERERQSLVDTPRFSSSADLSAAQHLSSHPPKEDPRNWPDVWGDGDDDD